MIRIAIVDDKKQNRNSLSDMISARENIEVCFLASNGKECLEKLKEAKNLPHLILMDIDMPIMDGIQAVQIANGIYPEIKFLMLTVFDDDEKIFEAIKSGAVGYLLKDESTANIIHAIEQVIEVGASPMSPRIARKALNMLMDSNIKFEKNTESDKYKLSEREKEILKLIVDGYEYKYIADKLHISPNTVRTHFGNIYEKLHVYNKAQAIKVALKNKWFLF